ncbi:Glutamate 5-kinase, partial [Elasticomyces elasticus]
MGLSKLRSQTRIHNGFNLESHILPPDAENAEQQRNSSSLVEDTDDELEAFRRREKTATRKAQKATTMKGHKKLTIVIKLGSSSIVDPDTFTPILPIITLIVATAVSLKNDGHRVIIVSSGAIAVGLQRMKLDKKPKNLALTQALAAIGQGKLIGIWDQMFQHYNVPTAQILLTRNDIADRSQYLNAQNTLAECLHYGAIPIVNENDTLSVSEIRFGDNDTLSAITAAMVHADYLFLMTDVDALYDSNPRTNPHAVPVEVVDDIDALAVDVSSRGSALGTGGMATKITAARLATSAGTTCIITKS